MCKVNLTLSGIGGMVVITLGTSVAKAKSKTILVQMMSAAGTGYAFNTKRNRLKEKLVIRKHDPFVNKHVLFFEKRKIKSI